MSSAPFGSSLLALFATIFLQLTLRVFFRKTWAKTGVYLVSMGLFCALCFSVQEVPGLSNSQSALFLSNRISDVFVFVILLFAFLNHLNFIFLDKTRDSEMLLFESLSVFFSVALLKSDNMIVMTIVLPLTFLLMSSVPLAFNKLIGLRSLTKGLVYSMALFLIWSGLTAYGLHHGGSIYFKDLNQVFKSGAENHLFFSWLIGVFSIWSLLFLPPFSFFDREYETTMSWPTFSLFRWQFLLLSVLLSLKWTFALCSSATNGLYEWGQIGEMGYNEVYFVLNLALYFWLAMSLWKTGQLHRFLTGLLCGPLLLGSFSFLSGQMSQFSWAILSFAVTVFGSVLISSMLSVMGVPLAARIEDVWRNIKWSLFPGAVSLFVVLILIAPAGNQIYFYLVREFFYVQILEGPQKWALFVMIFLSVAVTSATICAAHKMFCRVGRPESSERLAPLSIWHYILLIPFIILGIYPFPLYNYMKFALMSYF